MNRPLYSCANSRAIPDEVTDIKTPSDKRHATGQRNKAEGCHE
ncbi:hypothetical protein [Hymenobacter tibetensis]|nr:hypothetical protein [Hymenobacter tibetensis]